MRMWWRLLGLVVLFLGTQLLVSVFGTVVCSFLQIDPQGIDVLATLLLLSNLLVAVFLFGCRILPFKETFRRYSWNMKEVLFLMGLTLLAIIPVNGLTELLRLPDILQTSFAGLMANPLAESLGPHTYSSFRNPLAQKQEASHPHETRYFS